MTSTFLDSTATFKNRASEVGIPDDQIERAVAARISTLSKLAFACNYQPGAPDDKPLVDLVRSFLPAGGGDPAAADVAPWRRLHFEANAIALAEVKARVEAPTESAARPVPLAERSARYQQQKTRYPGLLLEGEFEPGHCLLDAAQQLFESNVASYITLDRCVSRTCELDGTKKIPSLQLVGTTIKMVEKNEVREAPRSELDFYYAFHRRALALDQVDLLTYSKSREWIQSLFSHTRRPVPAGFHHVSMDQILQADRELWVKIAEATRAGIRPVGAERPLQTAFEKYMNDPVVAFCLLPRPFGNKDATPKPPWKRSRTPSPGRHTRPDKSPPKKKKKKNDKASNKALPDSLKNMTGLRFRDREGNKLCFGFNSGSCRVHGPCPKGKHSCMKCGGSHGALQCRGGGGGSGGGGGGGGAAGAAAAANARGGGASSSSGFPPALPAPAPQLALPQYQ